MKFGGFFFAWLISVPAIIADSGGGESVTQISSSTPTTTTTKTTPTTTTTTPTTTTTTPTTTTTTPTTTTTTTTTPTTTTTTPTTTTTTPTKTTTTTPIAKKNSTTKATATITSTSGSSGSGDKSIGATTPPKETKVASNITTTTESASNITTTTESASNFTTTTESASKITTTTERLPEDSNVTEEIEVITQLPNTTTTALAEVTKQDQVVLVLKGNFNEVIGEGEENKNNFLAACTLKLSKNNTRDVRCADVRPGSIIVDIEGAPKQLEELTEELKTEKSFALEGYADFTVDKVDFISGTTTTESPPEEIEKDIGTQIINYLMENVGILVGLIIAAVLVLIIIGISIFICYKCFTCCMCCKSCKCKSGICCQRCQKQNDGTEKEMLNIVTETLVESKMIQRDSQGNQTVVISSPVVAVTDGSKTAEATTVVLSNPQIAESGALAKENTTVRSPLDAVRAVVNKLTGGGSNPEQLDEENAYAVEVAGNAAGQNAQAK